MRFGARTCFLEACTRGRWRTEVTALVEPRGRREAWRDIDLYHRSRFAAGRSLGGGERERAQHYGT